MANGSLQALKAKPSTVVLRMRSHDKGVIIADNVSIRSRSTVRDRIEKLSTIVQTYRPAVSTNKNLNWDKVNEKQASLKSTINKKQPEKIPIQINNMHIKAWEEVL